MEMGCNRAIYLSLGLAGIVHYPVTTSHLLKNILTPMQTYNDLSVSSSFYLFTIIPAYISMKFHVF